MQKAEAILGLIGERGKKGLPLEQRVYRLLFNRERCHAAVEHGLPITWTLITLKEVKRRRKAKTAILESRMP